MKPIIVLLAICLSVPAFGQFRSTPSQAFGSLIAPVVDGSGRCVIGHTTNGFTIMTGDGTNPLNSTIQGLSVCKLMGVVLLEADMGSLPGGNWRNTTAGVDIDPATAPCRFEGTVSTTSLTAMTCGVDP